MADSAARCRECGGTGNHFFADHEPVYEPSAAPHPEYERAVAIQRGTAPATTVRELVDAIRQDIAGAGACLSSLDFLAETHDLPVMKGWVERLGLHLARLSDKCSLAINEEVDLGDKP